MLGEMLVAVFLLAIAISSVTALMYSVGRQRHHRAVDCTAKAARALPECAKSAEAQASPVKSKSAAKLLVSGCATRTDSQVKECPNPRSGGSSQGTTLRSRSDSASQQLVPKKPERLTRPDLGFVR